MHAGSLKPRNVVMKSSPHYEMLMYTTAAMVTSINPETVASRVVESVCPLRPERYSNGSPRPSVPKAPHKPPNFEGQVEAVSTTQGSRWGHHEER